jgi:addiction module RelE/StbE family toxin
MYVPIYTGQFEKDLKRCRRRGKDLEKFKTLARTLLAGRPPDPIHRDHKLVGSFAGRRGCAAHDRMRVSACRTHHGSLLDFSLVSAGESMSGRSKWGGKACGELSRHS